MDLVDLLRLTAEKNASDLHLTVGVPPVLRINGILVLQEMPVLNQGELARILFSSLTDEQRAKFEAKWELDFSLGVPEIARFRVNIFKQRGSLAAAIRRIPFQVPKLEDLGLPAALSRLIRKEKGLVLVTGPTGSGKSTTLAAMIRVINESRACHILTIEDPIEYLHRHNKAIVNQREVGSDTFSFADALRSALREDPDVILVGEMRDLETMAIALTAAETGHLVFATLHTNSAAQSIDRVIDAFPPHQQQQVRLQMSTSLEGILSQRLLPTADGLSRVVAAELMIITPAIRNMIRDAKSHQIPTAIQTGGELGMQTMDSSLKEIYKRGVITYEEVVLHIQDLDDFNRFARPDLFVKPRIGMR
jgi:twitching motility protein PilT